jgi:hypothetical protein
MQRISFSIITTLFLLQVTAGMLIAVGTLGFFGARIRNRALLTFHAVGAILALVMLFEIVSMVSMFAAAQLAAHTASEVSWFQALSRPP